jgi:hypothetical protein
MLVGLLAVLVSRQKFANAAVSSEVGEAVQGSYLTEEKFQLTDSSVSDLSDLDSEHASLFFPENETNKRSVGLHTRRKCKTFPGDALWPSEPVWKLLDLITGGALIKTVPIGASCYDNFGVYDEARCDHLVDQWSNSSLQSVNLYSYPFWGLY